jgi:5'-methylthioadenosine phosphorylase
MKVGVIGGTGVLDFDLIDAVSKNFVQTEYGEVQVESTADIYFIQRHQGQTPPHRINHRAQIKALQQLGVQAIVGVGCCGSLKREIPVGSIVIPDDYICLTGEETFFDRQLEFVIPGLSEPLRRVIIANAARVGIPVRDSGIYMMTRGPRFETKAEIRLYAKYADILSMTLAPEITLSKELGLHYAAICSIDNYCHGIIDTSLAVEEVFRNARQNRDKVKILVQAAIGALQRLEGLSES